eukprot:CAMPEP_0202970370 /NCGR_PEP_ID=MMETSP1396-20130829/16319_1 /ASSEMBLY_ACC=CAM_ASM_000872 /TAXON_ID= /ORGANISM="Pseudokeronopsis sp., Strain Brazil" /LENGTH=61 /DNA_ID=CAMNT_0049698811 /DNA_START=818 /DNA_END=1003 /DNA_ORIENTATION=+
MSGAGPIDRRKRQARGESEPMNITLDYIFEKKPNEGAAINGVDRHSSKLKVRNGTCKVEKF